MTPWYTEIMARPPHPPKTALGAAMRERRGDVSGEEIALLLGVDRGTYYRIERGAHGPSMATALQIARWLGWTVDKVAEAATKPPTTEG